MGLFVPGIPLLGIYTEDIHLIQKHIWTRLLVEFCLQLQTIRNNQKASHMMESYDTALKMRTWYEMICRMNCYLEKKPVFTTHTHTQW
jgi:hypothetical protein